MSAATRAQGAGTGRRATYAIGLTPHAPASDTLPVQRRILIIDRDPFAWREIERTAPTVGCEVVCVPDAPAALRALAEGPFDLVLCDLDAPAGDGRDLVAELVRSPSAAPRAPEFALKRARKRFESDLIRRALRATDGNRTRAARLLEISHRALLYKLKEHGLGD